MAKDKKKRKSAAQDELATNISRHAPDLDPKFKRGLFEAHLSLANFFREVGEAGRKTEWTFSAVIWALLVGAAITFRGQPLCYLATGGALILALHVWWVMWNHQRANKNAAEMYDAVDAAARLLGKRRPDISLPPFYAHPASIVQLLATIGLLAGWLIAASPLSKAHVESGKAAPQIGTPKSAN